MALDDLRRRLFQKGEEFADRRKTTKLDRHSEEVPVGWKHEEPQETQMKRQNRAIVKWGVIGGAVIVGAAGLFFLASIAGFRIGNDVIDAVALDVEGGEEVSSGKKVLWKVSYQNDNAATLENAAIVFEFPPTAQPVAGSFTKTGLKRERRELGTLAPGKKGEEIFTALLFGAEGQTLEGRAVLEFRPDGSSARLSKEAKFESLVTDAVLGVEVEVPETLKAGQEADIIVRIVSSAETVFPNLSLKLEYPEAFEFVSSSPVPLRDNTLWRIGDLPAGGEYAVKIHGKVREAVSVQTFRASVGLYDRIENSFASFNSVSKAFEVSAPLLAISLEAKGGELAPGVTEAGNRLDFVLRWKNNLPVAVNNATVSVLFDGSMIDLRTLESERGELDPQTSVLRWVPGRVNELRVIDPGAEGTFTFNVTLKKEAPLSSSADKNFTVKIKSEMKTAEIPSGYEGTDISGHSEREYKVASRVTFSQRGYYQDPRIQNAGPIPPKVGKETTYVIVWSLVNSVNDLDGVVARATLPSYVRWTGRVVPSDSSVTFDTTTREVRWMPGKIPAGTGYTSRAREIAFQIGFTPSLPQVGQKPELITGARLEAQDSFTGTALVETTKEINTELRDDPAVGSGGGRVQE